jgi:hypothetical protein
MNFTCNHRGLRKTNAEKKRRQRERERERERAKSVRENKRGLTTEKERGNYRNIG